MSFQLSIQEKALALAKKFDQGQIFPEHVLLAVLQSQDGSLNEGTQEYELTQQVTGLIKGFKNIPKASGTVEITANAQQALSRCVSADKALEFEQELIKELFDIELSVERLTQNEEVKADQKIEQSDMSLADALAELDALVGLEQVKSDVRKLIAVHQANQVRVEAGLPAVAQSLHLVFTGSPGTGKTTIARCIANIYRTIGLLPNNGLVEVGRADLVAGYVGQTALKVQEVIQSARGGVLFIDEAYTLSQDGGYGYGAEAIGELVKGMENHRHELAVIAAGYKEDMNLFVTSNPGLKSRFQNFVNFPDYSPDELISIFTNLATANQVKISSDLHQHLSTYLAQNTPKGENGNARFVRNLFESMFKNMSARAAEDGVIEIDEITELQIDDLPPLESISGGSAIGFHS